VRKAALRPILGADKVARFLTGAGAGVPVTVEIAYVNGAPGLHILVDGQVETVVSAALEDGLITGLYAVRNPAKLTRIDSVVALAR
jgi:RNA polymerase sigma-70 factor (ECF subfamily)